MLIFLFSLALYVVGSDLKLALTADAFLEQLSAIVLTTDDISTTERLQDTRPTLCIMLVPFWEVKQIPTGGCGTCGFRSLSFLRR